MREFQSDINYSRWFWNRCFEKCFLLYCHCFCIAETPTWPWYWKTVSRIELRSSTNLAALFSATAHLSRVFDRSAVCLRGEIVVISLRSGTRVKYIPASIKTDLQATKKSWYDQMTHLEAKKDDDTVMMLSSTVMRRTTWRLWQYDTRTTRCSSKFTSGLFSPIAITRKNVKGHLLRR